MTSPGWSGLGGGLLRGEALALTRSTYYESMNNFAELLAAVLEELKEDLRETPLIGS